MQLGTAISGYCRNEASAGRAKSKVWSGSTASYSPVHSNLSPSAALVACGRAKRLSAILCRAAAQCRYASKIVVTIASEAVVSLVPPASPTLDRDLAFALGLT